MWPPGVVDLTRNSIYRKKVSYNSARSNVTCPERSNISLYSARSADLGQVNMRASNVFNFGHFLPSQILGGLFNFVGTPYFGP